MRRMATFVMVRQLRAAHQYQERLICHLARALRDNGRDNVTLWQIERSAKGL
jgi:hypothetical protein